MIKDTWLVNVKELELVTEGYKVFKVLTSEREELETSELKNYVTDMWLDELESNELPSCVAIDWKQTKENFDMNDYAPIDMLIQTVNDTNKEYFEYESFIIGEFTYIVAKETSVLNSYDSYVIFEDMDVIGYAHALGDSVEELVGKHYDNLQEHCKGLITFTNTKELG